MLVGIVLQDVLIVEILALNRIRKAYYRITVRPKTCEKLLHDQY